MLNCYHSLPAPPKNAGISLSKRSACADSHAETKYVSKSRSERRKMKQGVGLRRRSEVG